MYCTDYARQMLFDERAKLFDFANNGRIEFSSKEYIKIRSSLESMIRFAHDITITKFIYLLFYNGVLRREKRGSELVRAMSSIKDQALRNEIGDLIRSAHEAMIKMIIARSIILTMVLLLLTPLAVGYFAGSACFNLFKNVRHFLKKAVERIGNIIQLEAEHALENLAIQRSN